MPKKFFALLPGVVCGSAMLIGLAAAPAHTAPALSPGALTALDEITSIGYDGNGTQDAAETQKLFEAVIEAADARGAFDNASGSAPVTLLYNDKKAPTYQSLIDDSTVMWNGLLTTVQIKETTGRGDYEYRDGKGKSGGSHAGRDTSGAYIFFSHADMGPVDPMRVVTHETGHILGLPDNYDTPCSNLMSGGRPTDTSRSGCKVFEPTTAEIARVNKNFVNGGGPFSGIRAGGPANPTTPTTSTTVPTISD